MYDKRLALLSHPDHLDNPQPSPFLPPGFHLSPELMNNKPHHCCQGVCCAGLGNTGIVSTWSSPPPIGCWLCCHPMPVVWLTKAPCRKGLVPVGWEMRPCACCCCCGMVGRGAVGAKFFANGLVP